MACLFCHSADHRSAKCSYGLDDRKSALRQSGRCFVCTKKGHRADECQENRKSLNCQGHHHVFICPSGKRPTPATAHPAPETKEKTPGTKDGGKTIVATAKSPNEEVLFMMGLVKIYGRHGVFNGRMIIDTCSKLSYITSTLADADGLDTIN